jgi:hypothetical protein
VRAWHLVVYAFMPLCGLVVLWDGVVRADTEFIALGAFFMLFGIVMLAVNAGRYRKQP